MKTLLSFLLLLYMMPATPIAENKKQPGTYEKKGIEILSRAFNNLKAYDVIFMEFEFTSSQSDINVFDDHNGFLYAKGDKYYIKNGEIHFISDGILAWTFLEEVKEVHISYLEDTEGALSPISILENFEDEFMPVWLREEVFNNRKVHIIDMAPIEQHSFFKYRLGIDTQTAEVLFTTAFDRQGTTYTYIVTKTLGNPDVSDDFFTFDPDRYPGVEVVDLR